MSSARLVRTLAGASALTLSVGLVASTGIAWADNPLGPNTTFTMVVNPADGTVPAVPTDGEAIPNVDSVKSTLRAYYNAPAGVANKTSSRYINQVHAIENQMLKALPAVHAPNAAVVFDVDDTLLWTYDYTDATSHFNYDPTTNAAAVTAGFPAVPGMPQLLQTLDSRGYAIYGITGRPAAQEPDTITNLTDKGFTAVGGTALFNSVNLYTKDSTPPLYEDCTVDGLPACSTVEYKAFTRQHIATADSKDVVMNVGDQWSDLQGGYADDYTKIPNPAYFLASPDLPNAPASDALMVPPTSYVMQPDGSTGYSVASGDDIPNIDPVRKMIRAYYNADSTGVANKSTSNYISQLTTLESKWTGQVTTDCMAKAKPHNDAVAAQSAAAAKVAKAAKAVKKAKKAVKKAKSPAARKRAHQKLAKATKALKKDKAALAAITVPDGPALVFDADDTTLWNYDLEDGVLKFNYDPTVANGWVTDQKFPAVPGMPALVKAAAAAGCAVFGLTGRPASQQAATVANLAKVGFVDAANKPLFTTAQFFTKDTANQPWVDCGPDRTCSTVEYKGDTRAHIEGLGFDIVGNFGDQYSDLLGGHADHVYKVPNPTYYLP
jgi:predicted secreted acid phosphatase